MIINNRIITLVYCRNAMCTCLLANAAFARDICMLAHSKCVSRIGSQSSSIVAKQGTKEKEKGRKRKEKKNRVGIERSHQRRDCLPLLPTS